MSAGGPDVNSVDLKGNNGYPNKRASSDEENRELDAVQELVEIESIKN